jgi:hypothetical protein
MDTPSPKPGQPPEDPSRGPRGYGSYGSYGGYAGYGAPGYGNYGNYAAGGASGGKGGPFTVYLAMLRERWWWVLLSVLVFVTIAVVYTSTIIPEYRAAGRLRVTGLRRPSAPATPASTRRSASAPTTTS